MKPSFSLPVDENRKDRIRLMSVKTEKNRILFKSVKTKNNEIDFDRPVWKRM